MTVSRRRALALLATLPAATLAACSSSAGTAPPPAAGTTTTTPPTTTPPTTTTTTPPPATTTTAEPSTPSPVQPDPALPATTAWTPGPGEIRPDAKVAAARFLEAGGTWVDGVGAQGALLAAGVSAAAAGTVGALASPDATASTLQVRYPQYGGIEPDNAAVIALFDQHLLQPGGSVTTRQTALDLRLRLPPGGTWTVERINPLTSLGSTLNLSEEAEAVLADPRIELSAPARTDVSTGRMDNRLLRVLLGVAQEHALGVQVMHTGHIQTVYPTQRRSNHAVGRAVDIRTVDGLPVVDPATSRDLLTAVMTRAAELGATEVGGPFDLNGEEQKGFFTDDVHQDHLHFGISENKPPASR